MFRGLLRWIFWEGRTRRATSGTFTLTLVQSGTFTQTLPGPSLALTLAEAGAFTLTLE